MKTQLGALAGFLAVLVLGGCVSTGTKVTADQAAQFKRGVTTEAEMIAALGEPNSTARSADGTITDVYSYAHGSADASSYIPIVGLFAGGGKGKSNMATFIFTPDKVLKDYSTASSATHVKTGIFQ